MKAIAAVAFVFISLAGSAQAYDTEGVARVLSVTPRMEQVNQPRQDCRTEYVAERGSSGYTGAMTGGIAGGIIGNQIGRGNGQVVATAAGAIIGALTGDRIEQQQGGAIASRPVQTCRMVDNWQSRVSGYAVTYEYQGQTYSTVMPYDPGSTVRVQVSVTPR